MPTETQVNYLLHTPAFQNKATELATYFDCARLRPQIVFEALEQAYKEHLSETYNQATADRLKKAFDRTRGVVREAIKSCIAERRINTPTTTDTRLLHGSLSKVLRNLIAQDLLGNTQVPGILNTSSTESRTVATIQIMEQMQEKIADMERKQYSSVKIEPKIAARAMGLILIAALVGSTWAIGGVDVSAYGTLENQAENRLRENELYHEEIIAYLQRQGIPAVAIDTDRRDAGLNVQVVGEIQSAEDYKFRMVSVLVTYLDESGETNKAVIQIPLILNQSQQTGTSD